MGRRLDDMPDAVNIERAAVDIRPQTRGFKGDFGAGIENPAINIFGCRGRTGLVSIIGKAAADPRSHVQPAKKCLRQKYLMKRVSAAGGIIVRSKRPDRRKQSIRFGEAPPIIAGRTLALVVKGRVE